MTWHREQYLIDRSNPSLTGSAKTPQAQRAQPKKYKTCFTVYTRLRLLTDLEGPAVVIFNFAELYTQDSIKQALC